MVEYSKLSLSAVSYKQPSKMKYLKQKIAKFEEELTEMEQILLLKALNG